jgi:hypothetical protein
MMVPPEWGSVQLAPGEVEEGFRKVVKMGD